MGVLKYDDNTFILLFSVYYISDFVFIILVFTCAFRNIRDNAFEVFIFSFSCEMNMVV